MVRFYSVDRYGCVYCGETFLQSLRKALEAQRDGGGLENLERKVGVESKVVATAAKPEEERKRK